MDAPHDVTTAWYWEGNIVDALAAHLERAGWRIASKADTHSKQRGVDLHAEREGRTLLVEAKGFPSTTYRDPRRPGEAKPTNPTNQAQQWYSHALLKALRLQTAYPDAIVALAFPDFPRYKTLYNETRIGLDKLGVVFITVGEHGEVELRGFPAPL